MMGQVKDILCDETKGLNLLFNITFRDEGV